MNLSGKKLTTAILAGLMGATVAGISVVGAANLVVLNGTTLNVFTPIGTKPIKPIEKPVNVTNGIIDGTTKAGQGNIVSANNTVGQNLIALDTAIAANKNAIQKEISDRQAADDKLEGDMNTKVGIIQGQQDEQDTKIGKNQKDIQTNAGNIQKNKDAIKVNSDKLTNHEDRITTNESNIEHNAETIKKVQGDVVDEVAARQAADQNLQNQINNNSTSINDLYGRYSSLKTDINKVGARSAALAGLHPLDFDPANKLNFAVASGSFKGENSVALGAFYRPNENVMFSAASTMGDSDNAYTFGLSFKIGPSSAKTKTTSPDAEELYKVVGELQDQLAAQQKEIEQLKADKAK